MARPRKDTPIHTYFAPKGTHYNAAEEREMNFIGQRITEARRRMGLSQDGLRKILRKHGVFVQVAAISKWEHGETAPSAYQLLALWQALDIQQDITFFMSAYSRPKLNEIGRKKVAEYQEDLIASGRYKPTTKGAEIVYIDMPVSLLSASAGTGQFLNEDNFEQLSFPMHTVPEEAEFGVRVSGDSMEPVYHDGQIVWVQQCKKLAIGEVGIFIYDGEGYIKVYSEKEPSEEDREQFTDSYGTVHKQPVMLSYNQNYPPKVISGADMEFQIVGRVIS